MEHKSELSNVYSEVYAVLSLMELQYIDKIPNQLMELVRSKKNEKYAPNIKIDIPLDEQGLQRKTLAFLAMLNLNYWCENEKEKQELLEMYSENDRIAETELQEIYNPENIFHKKKQEKINSDEKQENKQMIESEEKSILKKILKKIMNFFKKNNN